MDKRGVITLGPADAAAVRRMSGPGDSPAASDNPPWRAARLLQAPHRLAFFAGAVLMAFSALWWAAALLARQMAVAWAWAVPPAAAHGLVMALAFMPMFMLGFLFTAGPRWLGQPEQPARRLLAPVAMMCAGWSVALPGFHWHAGWAAAGLAGVTLGWLLALARFTHLVRTSRVPDRAHARRIVVAAGLGGVAMTAATFGLVLDGPGLVRAAAHGALWAFVAPVFAIVAHRMIPFFTASVLPTVTAWRPSWLLDVMLATLWFTALVEVAQALWWPLPAAVHGLAAAVQAPAAVLLLWLALRWGLVQSLRIRLLAMLHGGFLWLGVAIALAAASHLRAALLGEGAALGLAPLHALTMGYLGATLFAMVTRVVAGHSGRPLVADNIAWALYWGLQLAVLLRLVAALGPQLPAGVLAAAALAWAAACAGWAARYGRWLGRPRADGRPG